MGRICKLICVSDCNNNKFYDMSDNGNDTWTASWGRVGARSETQIYSNHLWDKKYKEKLRHVLRTSPHHYCMRNPS